MKYTTFEKLEQELASRDAEVAWLNEQLADNNLFYSDRNQWRNNYRSTISDLTNERDQLREQVKMLRDAVETLSALGILHVHNGQPAWIFRCL